MHNINTEFIDTLTLQVKVRPNQKENLFNDFRNGGVSNVSQKWSRRKLSKPIFPYKNITLYGKPIIIPLNYDRFYYKPYPFSGGIGGYTIYYCHYKYRDDYLMVTLQHKVVENKSNDEIYQDTLMFLDSIGVDTNLIELDDKLNRIDYKRDSEASNKLEIKAFFNAISKCKDSSNNVDKITYYNAIKFKPKSSATEIIIYYKFAEMNSRSQKRSHIDLDIINYELVIRIELRLKSKRLYNNSKNSSSLPKNLSAYFNKKVADDHFEKFVEPIFYTEPFYRLDYALLAIQTDRRLTEKEAEKLCKLVIDINKKGFTRAKAEYNYSGETFDKHIKLLRSIGVNPLTFDLQFDIGAIPNFTTKEACRDYSLYDEENEELRQKLFDELSF